MTMSAAEAQRLHAQSRQRMDDEANARAEAAKKNREQFPDAAKFIDDVREIFPGAKVKYFGEPRPATLALIDGALQQAEPFPDKEEIDAEGLRYIDISLASGVEHTRPLSS